MPLPQTRKEHKLKTVNSSSNVIEIKIHSIFNLLDDILCTYIISLLILIITSNYKIIKSLNLIS